MSPPPTIYTPPSELDGTVAGMVITAVVASLALVMLIGMVYWANSHPDFRVPRAQRPAQARRPVQAAHPPSVASSRAQAREPEPSVVAATALDRDDEAGPER
jgi:predicted lipid-binding transport protein (Tim44 family)